MSFGLQLAGFGIVIAGLIYGATLWRQSHTPKGLGRRLT